MSAIVHKSRQKSRLLSTDDSERSATFILTNSTEDRDGETVDPTGGDFSDYSKNAVVAFNHDTDSFPIGMMHKLDPNYDGPPEIWLDEDDNGQPRLLGKVYFSKENPQGDQAYRMVKEGSLKGGSISFLPGDKVGKNNNGGNHYGNWKLLEFSICPVGSNPDAVKLSKGLRTMAIVTKDWHDNIAAALRSVGAQQGTVRHGQDHIVVQITNGKAKEVAQALQASGIRANLVGGDEVAVYSKTLKYYRKNKTAWVLKTGDGSPLDREMEEYLEQRELDEVRVEDEAPPEGEGWVEEEVQMPAPEEKAAIPSEQELLRSGKMLYEIRPAFEAWSYQGKEWTVNRDTGEVKILTSTKDIDTQDEDIVERFGAAMCKEGFDSDMVELAVKRFKKSLAAKRNKSAPPGQDMPEEKAGGGDLRVVEVKGKGWCVVRGNKQVTPFRQYQTEANADLIEMQTPEYRSMSKGISDFKVGDKVMTGPDATGEGPQSGTITAVGPDFVEVNIRGSKIRYSASEASQLHKKSEGDLETQEGKIDATDKAPSRYMALVSSNGQIFRAATNREISEAKRNGGEINVNGTDYDVMEVKGDGNDSYKPFSRGKKLKSINKRGYQSLKRLMKAIEDDGRDIEQPDVVMAFGKAMKLFKQCLAKAYGEMEDHSEPVPAAVDESEDGDEDAVEMSKGIYDSWAVRAYGDGWAIVDKMDQGKILKEGFSSKEDAIAWAKSSLSNTVKSKRLNKSDRAKLKDLMDYLDDVAGAGDTPKRLSAGMSHYKSVLKELYGGAEEPQDVGGDVLPVTPEEEILLEGALESVTKKLNRFDDSMFRVTGQRAFN